MKSEKINQILPSGKRDASFFESVYDIVRQVPPGRVTTYGAIAAALGSRLSSRMVGWAMNGSHAVLPPVPAHRVVNREGLLTGRHHFSTPDAMQEALEAEGVEVKDNEVVRFKALFWDPAG